MTNQLILGLRHIIIIGHFLRLLIVICHRLIFRNLRRITVSGNILRLLTIRNRRRIITKISP